VTGSGSFPSRLRRLAWTRRFRCEDGYVGGAEAIPLGILVLFAGTLIVVNAWAVVDARLVTATAAREAVRAYVEAAPATDAGATARQAWAEAELAANQVMVEHGRRPDRFSVRPTLTGPAYARCQRVAITATYELPAVTVPLVGGFLSGLAVSSTASEIVDPFRDGLEGSGCHG